MDKISKKDFEIAESKGISRRTVYRRVKDMKWSVERAIATPTDNKQNSKRERSKLYGVERGKLRSFKLPIENEEDWKDLVAESGLTEMDLATEIILEYLSKRRQTGNPKPS